MATIDAVLGGLYLLGLLAFWALPVVLLLKQKHVLLAVGLLLFVVQLAVGFGPLAPAIGLLVWVTGAIRLAPPASRWARQLYGPEKLARAQARPAGVATRLVAMQADHPPPADGAPADGAPADGARAVPPSPPRLLIVAAVLTMLGLVLFRNGWGAYAAAALLPVLWVMRTGWRRGRTIVAVVAALNVAWLVVVDVVLGAWTAYVDLWSVAAVGVLLVAVGTTLLFREPVHGFLRAGGR